MPGKGLIGLTNKVNKGDMIDPFEEDSLDWLELNSIPDVVANPLDEPQPGYEHPDPVMELTNILVNPDYLHFAAKILLNVEIPPYQAVILDTLWKRRLPLLIMTRGGAKSFTIANYLLLRMILHPGCKCVIVGAGLRQSRQTFDYMVARWEDSPILRDIAGKSKTAGPRREVDRFQFEIGDSTCVAIPLGQGEKIRGLRANYVVGEEFNCLGKNTLIETNKGLMRIGDCSDYDENLKLFTGEPNILEAPQHFIITPPTDVYKIITEYGKTMKCSAIHKVLTQSGWKLGKDLTTDDYIISDSSYEFPQEAVEKDGLVVDEDLAWLMGILIAEGSISEKYQIQVKMADLPCIQKIMSLLHKYTGRNINMLTEQAGYDPRGWNYKETYETYVCCKEFRNKLINLGLSRSNVYTKKIPWSILQSPKNVILSFLSGLFWGDGSASVGHSKKNNKKYLTVAYYSVCEQLIDEVQLLVSKLGIDMCKSSRKSKLSDKIQWSLRAGCRQAHLLFNLLNIPKWEGVDKQCDSIPELRCNGIYWNKGKNAWDVKIYEYGKTENIGRKKTREEAEELYRTNIERFKKAYRVRSVELLPDKEKLYDFYLPETHCFYGNGFKQHNSIPPEIFNVVVQGFGVVSSDPIEKMKEAALIKKMTGLGVWSEELESLRKLRISGNQVLRDGTASYAFGEFNKCFIQWKKIIMSRGDPHKLKEIMGEDPDIAKGFDWRDYAILRVPYTHIPEGILDAGILAQAKATLTQGQFNMEYSAIFQNDSDGFYKRSILESCTTNKGIRMPSGELIQFSVLRQGQPDKKYVIGVDPAAEADNAAIVVLEIYPDHRRIVHCWTTNRKKFTKFKQSIEAKGHQVEDDYYRYIAKQLRLLMRTFNTEHIIMDKNGGGIAIAESLATKESCGQNEWPIYEIIDGTDPKPNDIKDGLHILELIVPTNDINNDANHGMLRDFQDKILLFPLFDAIEVARSIELDHINNNEFDTYEDLVDEIEKLKNEITSIVVTQSPSLGKDTFNTPLTATEGIKGRLRKDRYSALLYANYYARNLDKRVGLIIEYKAVGGTRDTMNYKVLKNPDLMYHGPGILACQNPGWATGKNGGVGFVKHGPSREDPLYYF